MELRNKRIWITGASSGIGEAMARRLSGVASLLIVSGRNEGKLEQLADEVRCESTRVEVVSFDLGDSMQIEKAASHVLERYGGVDVLINNGGISQRSMAHETTVAVERQIMEVNFFGQVHLTKLMLSAMIRQGFGHIAVTSSLTGKLAFPMRSAYSASKHALHGFFETLGLELRSKGIRVTMVCPGRIKTDISLNALTGKGMRNGRMDPGQAKGMTAEKCAVRYLRAIEREHWEVYIGGADILMIYFRRFIPYVYRKLAMRVSAV